MKRLLVAFVLLALAAVAEDREDPVRRLARFQPAKGKPFAARRHTPPYEEVLDHCDLLLTGEVTAFEQANDAGKQKKAGRLEIDVEKVLRGKHEGRKATITFGGTGPWYFEDRQRVAVFCLRTPEGNLVLAGDPPEGGGAVREDPGLAQRLIEAARDPRKGYESEDFAVRLSSAYRLAMAWAKAPADKKPEIPSDLVPTLIKGLAPDPKWRCQNVNAAARDALNCLLDCNITMMWRYSVYHGTGRRREAAETVCGAWERTVRLVQTRRSAKTGSEPAGVAKFYRDKQKKEAAKYIAQLTSKDEVARGTAGTELLTMGDVGLNALAEGTRGDNPELVEACRALRREHFQHRARDDSWNATFDPEVASAFVPREPHIDNDRH